MIRKYHIHFCRKIYLLKQPIFLLEITGLGKHMLDSDYIYIGSYFQASLSFYQGKNGAILFQISILNRMYIMLLHRQMCFIFYIVMYSVERKSYFKHDMFAVILFRSYRLTESSFSISLKPFISDYCLIVPTG